MPWARRTDRHRRACARAGPASSSETGRTCRERALRGALGDKAEALGLRPAGTAADSVLSLNSRPVPSWMGDADHVTQPLQASGSTSESVRTVSHCADVAFISRHTGLFSKTEVVLTECSRRILCIHGIVAEIPPLHTKAFLGVSLGLKPFLLLLLLCRPDLGLSALCYPSLKRSDIPPAWPPAEQLGADQGAGPSLSVSLICTGDSTYHVHPHQMMLLGDRTSCVSSTALGERPRIFQAPRSLARKVWPRDQHHLGAC